jgi:hypothetical protein
MLAAVKLLAAAAIGIQQWVLEWLLSPGFAGAAAVLAAVIAYLAARRQAAVNRETARRDQWWDRARWALDLTLIDDPECRIIGLATLGALATSEWAAEHEGDVIAAATERVLVPPAVATVLAPGGEAAEEWADDREVLAAARTRVRADELRGAETEQWIVDLAEAGQLR